MSVANAFDDLALQPFFDVRSYGKEARNSVDDIDSQVKTVDLGEDGEFEWCVDVALLFEASPMNVVMILETIGDLVHECGIVVKAQEHRLVGGKERIPVAVAES